MPDANKALGQAVEQKPPDELDGRDRERFSPIFLAVLISEGHHIVPKGSRKNNFPFFMVRSNSSNLVVEYIVPSLFDAFAGQKPSYLYGNFSC